MIQDSSNQPPQMCDLRKQAHQQKGYTPKGSAETITPGTYYLTDINELFQRKYEIKA